eukprot:1146849-Pelagomonas_calceolata.AAC.3
MHPFPAQAKSLASAHKPPSSAIAKSSAARAVGRQQGVGSSGDSASVNRGPSKVMGVRGRIRSEALHAANDFPQPAARALPMTAVSNCCVERGRFFRLQSSKG